MGALKYRKPPQTINHPQFSQSTTNQLNTFLTTLLDQLFSPPVATYIDVGLYEELHQKLKTDDLTGFFVHSYITLQQHYRFMLQTAQQNCCVANRRIYHIFFDKAISCH